MKKAFNQRKTVNYVGFYDLPNGTRNYNLSAVNKMNYISDSLIEAGYDVNIISPSWEKNQRKLSGSQIEIINKNKRIVFCPTWGTQTKIMKYLKIIFSLVWLFLYLSRNVKKNDKILVYHTPLLSISIKLSKIIKRFEVILEVEEIYGSVWNKSRISNWFENISFDTADKFIFVSDKLKEKFNHYYKENLILYGSYKINSLNTVRILDKDKINILYAGSVDSTKGGASNAVKTAEYLPNKYKMNILGHGEENDIIKLQKTIDIINEKKGYKCCEYFGTLHGDAYSNFLYNSDIAINSQRVGSYMETAFPSKIVSYLSHNLRVVSTEIESVKMSKLSYLIYFSNNHTPQNIAKTIKSVELADDYNSKKVIKDLHKNFISDLKRLIG